MGLILRLIIVAGLGVDAYVHLVYAPDMAGAQGGSIGGDDLFRVQAGLAIAAALLVLIWDRRWAYAIAFLVAASALGAVLLYYFVDVGQLGPLPEMYEPVWYGEKTWSAVGEGLAALAALVGFATVRPRDRGAHVPRRDLTRQH